MDPDAVTDHVRDHVEEWTTTAGLLPERVDGDGNVSWNADLQWSQAMDVLLVENRRRGEPFGMTHVTDSRPLIDSGSTVRLL